MAQHFTFFTIFVVIAELFNLCWHLFRKDHHPVNTWQVVVIMLAAAGCDSLNWELTFLSFLLLWYLVGVSFEKYGNPLNFNMVSSVLLGAYFMALIVIVILNHPCREIGECLWHDWTLQGMCH